MAYDRQYYLRNKEKILSQAREWSSKNPDRKMVHQKKRLDKIRLERQALRAAIFAKHGGGCVHCGFTDPRALQIDHVFSNGWKDADRMGKISYLREVLADTEGIYQVLCANCNWIKRDVNKEFPGAFSTTVN